MHIKHIWVASSKDEKDITITNAFQKTLDNSKHKPNKMWVGKGSKFYNRSMQLWLQDNDIVMYLTHNAVESIVAERFVKILKNKIDKYMTSYHLCI